MPSDWAGNYLILLRLLVNQLSKQPTDTLPPVVCGLLSSLLPPLDDLAHFRSDLAGRLRATSDRLIWFREAELAEVCAVLDGLHAYDSSRVTGADMAALTERLVASEATVGGPYLTRSGLLQVSTNAFVQQTLHWLAEPLPNVSSLLISGSDHFKSPQFSPAEQTLLYVLEHRPRGVSPEHLEQLQAYSQLFVAALAAQLVYQSEQDLPADAGLANLAASVYAQTWSVVAIEEPLAGKTRSMLADVILADANYEIAGLAWMYGQAIGHKVPATNLYVQLGTANAYAWAAYTIYDDFLDEEGEPNLLPTGNYLMRACLRKYQNVLPSSVTFQIFVEAALSTVDAANTFETLSLRFPTTPTTIAIDMVPPYESLDLLADRALFHALGPMGVLAATGDTIGGNIWQQTLEAFRHYLIARQLNDDIHDWVKDLRAGQISFVVASLLRYLGTTPGVYNLSDLVDYARPVFRQDVLPAICEIALQHIAEAKQMPTPNYTTFAHSRLMQLFTNVESSMHAALKQRTTSLDFINQLHL